MTAPKLSTLPQSRVPDPREAQPVRWGILGPGWIAERFAFALRQHTRQQIAAVASRSADRANAFAKEYGVDRVHSSYAELVADPDVDVVYVATPHSEHLAHALLAIEAGKPVLVEKAFARSAAEARQIAAAARDHGVLAMEAMWTRFLPHIDVVRQLVTGGDLGEIVTVTADHGQYFYPDPAHRLFAPELAGGALLDLGIYPISFAAMILGTAPDAQHTDGSRAFTGVDAQAAVTLRYGEAVAQIGTTLLARTPTTAAVSGTVARIELASDFYAPTTVTYVHRDGSRVSRPADPIDGHEALAYQAAHVASLVIAGETESPLLPLDETVAILAIVDEARRELGVSYPGE